MTKITFSELQSLERAWHTAQSAGVDSQTEHIAYLRGLGDFIGVSQEAYITMSYGAQAVKQAEPAPADTSVIESPAPSESVSTRVDTDLSSGWYRGTVKFYKVTRADSERTLEQGYGYIKREDGAEFYFRRDNLQHATMPIKAGDRVTFTQVVTVAENAGMPTATRVLVEGYTPPAPKTTGPTTEELDHVRQQREKDRAMRQKRKAERQARDEANRQSLNRVFGKQG